MKLSGLMMRLNEKKLANGAQEGIYNIVGSRVWKTLKRKEKKVLLVLGKY